MSPTSRLRRNLPVLGAAVRNIVIFTTVLSIPLTAAGALGLSAAETSSWILALYALPALLSLILSIRYRQPILFTGNLFVIIFINGLGGQLDYPELIGASLLAGALVLLIGILNLTERFARYIPVPVVFGLLAGAVVPFVSDLFSTLGDAPAVVGGTFVAYLLSRRFLGTRVPAIMPAVTVGFALAALTGQFEPPAQPLSLSIPQITLPVFSLPAIITVTPVLVVLITIQSNLPSVRFLQGQDYDPPELAVDVLSGLGTMLGSLLGPTGVSLSLPATSLVAGPEAGEQEIRHRSVYLAAGVAMLVGLWAGIAAGLATTIPVTLLLTLAGLSVVAVFGNALERIAKGPLLLGPLFAFAIALSDISFLGFGNYFWSLAIGTGVSLLLERDGLRSLRDRQERQAKANEPQDKKETHR